MTHICVSKLTIFGSDNGLSPGRHQAIIWTNDWIMIIVSLETNFSEINLYQNFYISFQEYALENGVWKLGAILSRPQCVLKVAIYIGKNIITLTQHGFRATINIRWIKSLLHIVASWQWRHFSLTRVLRSYKFKNCISSAAIETLGGFTQQENLFIKKRK